MKCEMNLCQNKNVHHFHRLDKTWYCPECAKKIQDFENKEDNPQEIFKEFYRKDGKVIENISKDE